MFPDFPQPGWLCNIVGMKKLLVTGSSGLIGSEVAVHFGGEGWQVFGVDNNQRKAFFGEQGDNRGNQKRLEQTLSNFQHHELDVRDREQVLTLVAEIQPDAIVHTAAQPSHDKAAALPFADFDTNATGTFNMLEATRRYALDAPFVHLSTNKVYGEALNALPLQEGPKRYEFTDERYEKGIGETFPVDQTRHSLFGASKLAADIAVQEYGRYFSMPTAILRGGCLTGPNHAGVAGHGFLNYLIQCNLKGKPYTIFGYKGKQVRDNIHAYDVACFIKEIVQNPGIAEVYNLGGGKANTCSILEAMDMIEHFSGRPMAYHYVNQNRVGDHICYYSDLSKIRQHYPKWDITKPLDMTIEEIYKGLQGYS